VIWLSISPQPATSVPAKPAASMPPRRRATRRLTVGLLIGFLLIGFSCSAERQDVMLSRLRTRVLVLGNGAAEGLQGDHLGFRATALAGVEGVDRGELVGGEVEVEDVDILRDPGRLGRLRDD
jgi:hypothetical protein